MFIQSDISPLSTYVLQCICLFYVVVNCPPNVLRQQRAVIPVTSGAPVTVTSGAPVSVTSGAPVTVTSGAPVTMTSGAPVTVTSGASGVPVTSVTPVTTAGVKQSQGKHRGEERYVYTYLAK